MKQIVFILIIILGIGAFLKFGLPKNLQPQKTVANPVLVIYWGQGCPHCENVKKFISENQIDSKLQIDLKEVYNNKNNQIQFKQDAEKCNPKIDLSQGIGVPFAFASSNNECIIGDQPIIGWIKNKISTSSTVLK